MKIIAEHLAKNGEKYYFADDRRIYKKDENGNMIAIDLKAKTLTEEASALKIELAPGETDVVENDVKEKNVDDIEK